MRGYFSGASFAASRLSRKFKCLRGGKSDCAPLWNAGPRLYLQVFSARAGREYFKAPRPGDEHSTLTPASAKSLSAPAPLRDEKSPGPRRTRGLLKRLFENTPRPRVRS